MTLTMEQQQGLLSKAVQDEAFRAALQSDARAAIAQELQLTLPPEFTPHVLTPEANELYLVVPPYPADWPEGLSVEALEQRLSEGLGPLANASQTLARGQAKLVAKAWHDAGFKEDLLREPKAVVEREFGTPLPSEVTLRAFADDAENQHLMLPPALTDLELSDEQLEQVAGGELVGVALFMLTVSLAAGSISAAGSYQVAKESGW